MNNTEYYNMIFKRKSFRRFNQKLSISEEGLVSIRAFIQNMIPLFPDISYGYKIVEHARTTSKRLPES